MLQHELRRLSTFCDPQFTRQTLPACLLARLGFFIERDSIVCSHCSELIARKSDTIDENTLEQHRRLRPQCQPADATPDDSVRKILTQAQHNPAIYRKLQCDGDAQVNCMSPVEVLTNCFARAEGRGVFKLTVDSKPVIADREDPDFELLQSEMTRLATFYDWPADAKAKPEELVKAGLFYTGRIDRVQCAFCKNFLRNWTADDVPMKEHKKHFPECSFVQRNFDLGKASADVLDTKANPKKDTPFEGLNLRTTDLEVIANPLPVRAPQRRANKEQSQPLHPSFADESRRLQSYTGKATPLGQNVSVLANAGFFYVGPDDEVMCHYCNGMLKNWTPADDPWVDHAKFFPRCGFLRSKRDRSYIQVVQDTMKSSNLYQRQLTVEGISQGDAVLLGRGTEGAATAVGGTDDTVDGKTRELEENAALWDIKTCKVCVDEEVNVVFLPCGHLVCCNNCAPSLRNCPVCRALIRGTVRVFLS